MIESSDDGIEIDFEDEELDSPIARAGAGGFIKLFRAVWDTLSVEPVSVRRAGEAKLSIELSRLTIRYMQEAMACFEGKAWFASALMGMATMESLLMLACIADKSSLLTTKSWTSFHKKAEHAVQRSLAPSRFGDLGQDWTRVEVVYRGQRYPSGKTTLPVTKC